jgi:Tfp pilus assembly protein PilZ
MADERRQYVRLNARLMTFVKVVDTGKVQRSLATNISGVGLCVPTDRVFPPGTALAVEIQLPDRSTPIALTGEVVWSVARPRAQRDGNAADTGIRFVQVDAKDRAAILQYASLNALSPDTTGA